MRYLVAWFLAVSVPALAAPATPTPNLTGARVAQKLQMIEGLPVELRPPEKSDDELAFPQQTRAPYHHAADWDVVQLTDQLHGAWAIAPLPSGNFLLTERLKGVMRLMTADGTLSDPLTGMDMLAPPGKLGLLDVVTAPDFGRSNRIYFSFFEAMADRNSNTFLASGILDETNKAVRDLKVVFRAQPYEAVKNFGLKQGGRIAFGKDGSIFLSVGDRDMNTVPEYELALAQNLGNHIGKIVRIMPDGRVPRDNPFVNKPGAMPEIWAYGIRSPEGMAVDPRTGKLWESEHGPRGGDELNLIKRGGNYGWPTISRGLDYPGTPLLKGEVARPGMEQPVYYWDPVIGPSGLAIYDGKAFPAWKGDLLVGGLRGAGVYRLTLKNNRVVSEEPILADLRYRVRDVRVGPEGAVYVVTDGDRVFKITPRIKAD